MGECEGMRIGQDSGGGTLWRDGVFGDRYIMNYLTLPDEMRAKNRREGNG